MRTFGTFLAVGILALAAGCGGSSNSTGACNYPSCIASLGTTCAPSGTCVEQTDATTFATNTCYSNGVKSITSINATTGEIILTIKNGSSTCYSMTAAAAASGSSYALTINNGSGQTIATGTDDITTGGMTVTCTGGQPVTLDPSCDTGMNSTCATGTCTP